MKNDRWVFHDEAKAADGGEGVTRRVLAYSDSLMCVENTFEAGAIGKLHSHPNTQITYVVSGAFEFEIGGVKKRYARATRCSKRTASSTDADVSRRESCSTYSIRTGTISSRIQCHSPKSSHPRLLSFLWTARRSNQPILKEISPGISLEGMMLKLKLQDFGHLM